MQRLWRSLWLFLIVALVGCGSSTPEPVPTATPIPGYVGGEEAEAYTSFIAFYKEEIIDCTWTAYEEIDMATFLDTDYPGKAVYVGDGIWRFHVQIGKEYVGDRVEDPSYKQHMAEYRSLPDRTWQDKCNRESHNDRDRESEYPDYGDEADWEEPVEPEFEWP